MIEFADGLLAHDSRLSISIFGVHALHDDDDLRDTLSDLASLFALRMRESRASFFGDLNFD